jgi:hypothetical protein
MLFTHRIGHLIGFRLRNRCLQWWPGAGDLVLLVHLSLNHVATELHCSNCGDRRSADAQFCRHATAGPSGHWLRVAEKATPPTHTREGLALGGATRPVL